MILNIKVFFLNKIYTTSQKFLNSKSVHIFKSLLLTKSAFIWSKVKQRVFFIYAYYLK